MDVDVGRLGEEVRGMGGVVEDEQRHHDVASHVVKTTGQEVLNLLVVGALDVVDALLVEFHERAHSVLQGLQVLGDFVLEHFLHDGEVGAVGDVTDGSHHLQLRRAFVDGEDTGVAVEALALVLHDEARTTVDADGIVGVLVGVLGVHALGQRREGIGEARVFLALGALLGRQRTLALDVLKALVDVDITGSHVEQ